MKRRFTLAAALLMSVAAFAQQSYVSTPLVKAMESGKFYMKLDGKTGGFSLTMETAMRGGVSMSRTEVMDRKSVMLTSDGNTYQLDEGNKTWSAMTAETGSLPGKITFVRQGTCAVNGENGWYYDEYTGDGLPVTFYYKTGSVAIIDIGGSMGPGPMSLLSFSSAIPANMYFCVGRDWKGAGVSMGTPAPPQCSRPWTDSAPFVNLASGKPMTNITITRKQGLDTPVYASSLQGVKPVPEVRKDKEVTDEGILKAFALFQEEEKGKDGMQIQQDILDFNRDLNLLMMGGIVSGELAEMAIARCKVYPHPALLLTTGTLLLEVDKPETALKYFEVAEELAPGVEEPLYGQVESLLDMGRDEKARTVVPKIIEITRKKPEPDGRAWQLRAMLNHKENLLQSIDDLFYSIALGYFDDNSVMMVSSLIFELKRVEKMATQENEDFMAIVNRIFSDKNLDNIRKGITFGATGSYSSDPSNFSVSDALALESNYKGNYNTASQYEHSSDTLWQKINQAETATPQMQLLMVTDAAYLPDNLERIAGYLPLSATAEEGVERAYTRLSGHLAAQYGVEGFYLQDLRAFWCLRLLEQYHQYQLNEVSGNYGDYDPATRTFSGKLPETWKTRIRNLERKGKEMANLDSLMFQRHEKEFLAVTKKCNDEYERWMDAHPEASDSAAARAYRRIYRPQRILIEVTHPTEILDQSTIPHETYEVQQDILYFNETKEPVYNAWWEDMSRYCQYCTDASVSAYFWNRTLSDIYGSLGSLYHSKGTSGEFFHEERVRIAKRLAAIQNEAWQDHDQANQEYWQAKRDAKLAKDFKDKQFLGLSDLHLTFKTPSGGIHFGLKDGKWGVHLDMDNNYIKPRPLRLKGMKQEPVPNENANNFLQLTLEKTLSTLGQMLTGTDIVDKAISVVKGATTELVETKTSNKTDLFRDSGGNYHINRQQTERIIFAGKLEGRSDYYQVGGVKLRKNSAAFNLSDFLSFSAGGYSR